MPTRQELNLTIVSLILILVCGSLLAADQKQPISTELQKTIESTGIDAAVKQYYSLKQNHADEYKFDEQELNNLGYTLVQAGKLEEAIRIFELNLNAYPNSANCHDSLGEAHLRKGNHQKATEMYEQALTLLAKADKKNKTNQSLIKNAKAKLNYLRDPGIYKNSTVVVDFLDNNDEYPYGRLHPQAPPETEHWGRLAGEWDCSIDARLPNGNWVKGGKARWIWKYALDGFAVQDLWFQQWINLPPSSATLNRDVAGINFRLYLPAEKRWEAVWFANSANTTSRFDAISDNKKIVMTGKNNSGRSRITFFDITDTTFEWKSENSKDDGKTWQVTARIHGTRVK